MNLTLLIVYLFFLLAALGYGGLIIYHVKRYKSELYDGQAPRAVAVAWFYAIVGGSILLLSIILAALGPVIVR